MRTRNLAAAAALVVAGAGCRQDALGPHDPGSGLSRAAASATPLVFRQVSSGGLHTCAVTGDDRAYCWGYNGYGQLGNGTNGGPDSCLGWPCSRLPVAAAGDLRFRLVTAGFAHSCGITTDDRAFCWGRNDLGQLGNGTIGIYELLPVPVAGGLAFAQLDAGSLHTCGVTATDRRAYCWGHNGSGQLGNRTTMSSPTPVAVEGQRRFRHVRAAGSHTCGVTELDRAFCWGNNRSGQLGDGTQVRGRLRPVLVAGGHAFKQVDAGGSSGSFGHTCGVTREERTLCWGNGLYGQLGDGTAHNVFLPTPLAGGLELRRVSTGDIHTCGETASNQVYCWGRNTEGQLGDGTISSRTEPVAVSGDRRFRQVTPGGFHTCGANGNGVAFCWGDNLYGQLGDGTSTTRLGPTRVRQPAS